MTMDLFLKIGLGGILFFIIIYLLTRYIKNKFKDWRENLYLEKINYSFFEILIPQEIERAPIAMENFFSSLHGTILNPSFFEYNFRGIREPLFSFEIVGKDGLVYFFIRVPQHHKELVQSHIYSNFPTIEIKEREDWIDWFPQLKNSHFQKNGKEYDLWGGELILNKEDAYPIKTYLDYGFKPTFEKEGEEERITDPIASILEVIGKAKKGETFAYQLIISPENESWKDAGLKLRDKLIGRTQEAKTGFLASIFGIIFEWLWLLWLHIAHFFGGETPTAEKLIRQEKAKKEELYPPTLKLSPGEQEIVKALERNISKLGFKCRIRLLYFAPKEIFDKEKWKSFFGAFTQFNTLNLNGFALNKNFYFITYSWDFLKLYTNFYLWIKHKKPFPLNTKNLLILRKKEHFLEFVKRGPGGTNRGHRSFILNTEELATIWHFPGKGIVAPYIKRIEAKRRRPPTELPRI